MNTIALPVEVIRALCDLGAIVDDRTEIEEHALEAAMAALDVAKHANKIKDLTS